MLRNFIKIAFRNLYKNKLFVLTNILGLGLALSICIVAYFNKNFADDFDAMHINSEKIYKINVTKDINGRLQKYGTTPTSLAPAIVNDISGIDKVVRVHHSWSPLKYGKKIFNKRIVYGGYDFFEMFTYPLKYGHKNSFKDKSKIFISEQIAEIYFGDKNPIGEILLTYNGKGEELAFIVGAVFEKMPLNSSMVFDAIIPFENYLSIHEINENDWKNQIAATFIQVSHTNQIETINDLFKKYISVQNKANEDWKIASFYTVPLKNMADHSRDIWANWLVEPLHPAAIWLPTIMGILILLLACFNFTNITIALSGKRLKEIGVRKVVGGKRKQLIIQFFAENLLICFLALLVALYFAHLLISEYSSMWDFLSIELNFSENIGFWGFLLTLLLLTGFIAGGYPAIYITSFNPVKILKGKTKLGGTNTISKILLTLQFTISIIALVSSVIFMQNAYYQNNADLGYNRNSVLGVRLDNQSDFTAFRDAVQKNPKITSIGSSHSHIGKSNYTQTFKHEGTKHESGVFDIGHDYFNTMELKLTEGREFDIQFEGTDINKSIIVNEKFVKEFALKNPIGERLSVSDTAYFTIIGVVKNFYEWGFWDKIRPTAFLLTKQDRMRYLTVKAKNNDLEEINNFLKSEWGKIIPNSPYEGFYQEDTLKSAKDANKNLISMFGFLAIIAVILSIIGFYTLISLNIINRVKEIGIRKVLGSSIFAIMTIISKPFIIMILIASIIGSFIGYYLNDLLLSSIYQNYTDINIISFLLPTLSIIIISMLTIGGKVYKAANQNPVESLIYE